MANDRNFPLLASDQADVIRIFLDLMIQRDGASSASGVTSNLSAGTGAGFSGPLFASDMPDLD